MKLCKTCNTQYPATLEFFTKCSQSKDGLYRKCKTCKHLDDKKQNDRKSEWTKAYMKERRADPVIGEVLRKRALKRKHDIYYNSPFSRKNITQERVQNDFTYCPETGTLTYNGAFVYTVHTHLGYNVLYIDGNKYPLHRFVWFYVYGTWVDIIDHINGDKQDNRICNLRDVNTRENALNTVAVRNGRLPGAYKHSKNKWKSVIYSTTGNSISLGLFNDERSASLAYCRYCLQHNLVRREFIPSIFTDEELYNN